MGRSDGSTSLHGARNLCTRNTGITWADTTGTLCMVQEPTRTSTVQKMARASGAMHKEKKRKGEKKMKEITEEKIIFCQHRMSPFVSDCPIPTWGWGGVGVLSCKIARRNQFYCRKSRLFYATCLEDDNLPILLYNISIFYDTGLVFIFYIAKYIQKHVVPLYLVRK